MQLYLMRHGHAEPTSSTGRDEDRVLSPEGVAGVNRVLLLAAKAGFAPTLLVSSPYTRAVQTAELAADALNYAAPTLRSAAFEPDSSPFRLWDEVRAHADQPAILLVSHEPLLSSTVAWFAGSTRVMVRFVPAGLVRIDFAAAGPHPDGLLQWMITPDLA